MKKIILLISLVAAMICTSACGVIEHSLYPNSTETRVNLSQNNFRVVGTVEGVSTATYIFGIGSPGKSDAVRNMYKNANLQGAQKIIDISVVTRAKTILGIVNTYEYSAIGVIIEFTD